MSVPRVWGRFDDLRSKTASHFSDVDCTLVATRPEQVVDVLAEIDDATRCGWWAFGFLSYEAAAGLNPSLAVHDVTDGLPLAWFGIAREPARVPVVRRPVRPRYRVGDWLYEWSADDHRDKVEAVRQLIAAGETYQTNLTTRLTAEVSGAFPQLYANLVCSQDGAYNAYLHIGDFAIASASPELFFELADDNLLMRPMKGTARRGYSMKNDQEIAARLQANEKERAENTMIVDLVRNDVAQLAVTGGVSVTRLCNVETFGTVHQLVSDVAARIRPGLGMVDIFRALFPSGSITGAPKHRTMKIIRDLEPTPRGIYCGAIGIVTPVDVPVRARFNVAIRTLSVDLHAGRATYGTGGGITWSSQPAAEYAELRAKAEVLTVRQQPSAELRAREHTRSNRPL